MIEDVATILSKYPNLLVKFEHLVDDTLVYAGELTTPDETDMQVLVYIDLADTYSDEIFNRVHFLSTLLGKTHAYLVSLDDRVLT